MNEWFAALMGCFSGSLANIVVQWLPQWLQQTWRKAALDYLSLPAENAVKLPDWWRLVYTWQDAVSPRVLGLPLLNAAACIWAATHSNTIFEMVGSAILAWFLSCLTVIDARTQLLPDELTLPLLWAGLLWRVVGGLDLTSALIGAAAAYLFLRGLYHLFHYFSGQEAMGFGDFKLAAALGAWLGWQMLLPMLLLSALGGLAFALLRQQERDKPLAFGPFLALAGWLCWQYRQQIESVMLWYLM